MEKQLILASQSARRKELLAKIGIPFSVDAADIDETIDFSKPIREEIQHLAYRKAKTVFTRHPDGVVIGSDTVVVLDQEVLGKPENNRDAEQMLRRLSGRVHQVITGVCILSSLRCHQEVSVAEVTFASLSEEEIHAYVSGGEPMDKAGAYAIQGKGACFITGIQGDFYTIVGLPVQRVYMELKSGGY